MKLVIAEKPSVGKDIAKVLGATHSCDGYMEGNGYICSWAYGHLVTLYDCQDYDEKWKNWKELPVLPEVFKTKVINDTGAKKQFKILKELMFRDDVDTIICATDAGREGELIFRHIYNQCRCRKPIERLWNNSMADLKRDFQNLQEGNSQRFINLYHSAYAREKADWLVGMNLTRHFSNLYCSYGDKPLSIGRVQTPTLKMIVDRENEIKGFKKNYYYKLQLTYKDIVAENDEKLENKEEATQLAQSLDGTSSIIADRKVELKKKKAPLLHDIGSLQKECNKRLSLSAKETLNAAQKLYEAKLITYPRTDSKYLNASMKSDVDKLVEELKKEKEYVIASDVSKVLDDSKVTDHHAIIPTANAISSDIGGTEKDVLDIVIDRTIKAVAPDMTYEHLSCVIKAKDIEFKASINKTMEKGWTILEKEDGTSSILDEEAKKNQSLYQYQTGDVLNPVSVVSLEKETKPKSRYTDETLINAMEKAGAKDFKEIDEVERVGLGTGATRADVIETLISRGYIERKKKQLIPTQRGIELIKVVPENITDVKLTVEWEEMIADIKTGKLNEDQFVDGIKKYVSDIIGTTEKSDEWTVKNKNVLEEKCPECGSNLVVKKGKYGKFTACSNYPACKYIKKEEKKQPKQTGKTCPNCGSPLVKRKGKFSEFIACSNYPGCKYTEQTEKKKLAKETKMKCPHCGKPLVERKGKFGKFIACSGYPACKYIKK